MKLSNLNEVKIYRALEEDEQHRRDHQLLHEQLLKQNWDLREALEKNLNEMEELKRFQGSTFNTIQGENWSKTEILELTAKIQEYRMKLIAWMIREISKMLNQYAVGSPTLPVNQRFSHLSEILAEC